MIKDNSFGNAADLEDFEALRKYLSGKEIDEKEWKEYIMNVS
jgi:hypothetical protein